MKNKGLHPILKGYIIQVPCFFSLVEVLQVTLFCVTTTNLKRI